MKSIKMRGVIAAVSGALLFGAANVALADSTDDLLKMLRDKGVLSEKEYDDFNATRDVEKVKKSTEIKASFKDGVVFESGDKSFQIQPHGRMQLDYRNFDHKDGVVNADTFDIRRAYIGVKGKFFDSYDFDITYDAGVSGTAALDVAWFGINWWDQARFRFGQFKMPMSIEEQTSSRFIDFQERSFVNGQAPAKERGAMVFGKPFNGLYYALALSNGAGKNGNESTTTAVKGPADSPDVIGRVYANFAEMMNDKTKVLHVGAAFSAGEMKGDASGPSQSTEARGIKFFDTAAFAGTDSIDRNRVQLESSVAFGPVKLQGEWIKTNYEGKKGTTSIDKDIKAWYAEALWLITGENYADSYKEGAYGRIKPKNDFIAPGAPGWGALEVGVRRSSFDASDFKFGTTACVTGTGCLASANVTNEADAWDLGLKWMPNGNTRFMLNYIKTDFETPVTVNSIKVNEERAITARAQFDF